MRTLEKDERRTKPCRYNAHKATRQAKPQNIKVNNTYQKKSKPTNLAPTRVFFFKSFSVITDENITQRLKTRDWQINNVNRSQWYD